MIPSGKQHDKGWAVLMMAYGVAKAPMRATALQMECPVPRSRVGYLRSEMTRTKIRGTNEARRMGDKDS